MACILVSRVRVWSKGWGWTDLARRCRSIRTRTCTVWRGLPSSVHSCRTGAAWSSGLGESSGRGQNRRETTPRRRRAAFQLTALHLLRLKVARLVREQNALKTGSDCTVTRSDRPPPVSSFVCLTSSLDTLATASRGSAPRSIPTARSSDQERPSTG